jgi:Transposase DDE domain
MMPELYHKCLAEKLTHANYLLTMLLIDVIQSIKEVTLEKIAKQLQIPIKFQSRRKKIQRFLSLPEWNAQEIWMPIVWEWLGSQIKTNSQIYLAIDRTQWQSNNILMACLIWRRRAIPLYWEVLPQLGNSTFESQTTLLRAVLSKLSNYHVVVLGDREFCNVSLANWLAEQRVDFCLRLKKNLCLETEQDLWHQIKDLELSPGNNFFFEDVTVRKTAPITGFNVPGKWLGKYRQIVTKEPWYIITSLADVKLATAAYSCRFGIEEMFRDFKGGGYDLEQTNVTGTRLDKIMILLSLADLKSIIQGCKIKQKQVQEYLGRPTELGRKYARHSTFHIGLWGGSWVKSLFSNWNIVVELMSLSPHKRLNYQQGLRAIKLTLCAL